MDKRHPLNFLKAELEASLNVKWRKNEVVKRDGILREEHSLDNRIYLVNTGCIVISTFVDDEELIIRFGYPGDVIVAMDSFFMQSSSPLIFKAIRKSEVNSISRDDFIAFINEGTDRKNAWIELLGMMIVDQMDREKDLMLNNPKARLERVYKRSPHLFQEVPAKYIANYLRMSAETLSRLRSQL